MGSLYVRVKWSYEWKMEIYTANTVEMNTIEKVTFEIFEVDVITT